jgi:Zn-dependent M16 (insulinase) family peptidase
MLAAALVLSTMVNVSRAAPILSQELAALDEKSVVEGYRVLAVYVDTEGKAMGARLRHPNGMTVDLMRCASVPQVSANFGTLPESDKGEPHTQEHLLLGKGKAGKYLNSAMSMSLAEQTAATYTDLTNYQFHTEAGPQVFYRLLGDFLGALMAPDYTDEEIRREVANLEVVKDPKGGGLALEEKGTIYVEMVSSSEKADYVNWYQMTPLVFGAGNPMSYDSGGRPAAIRAMVPEDIRRFHREHYHFGGNLSMIAALPEPYSLADFLKRLNGIMDAVEPGAAAAPARAPQPPPPFKPAPGAPVVIGSFPNEEDTPQTAILAFKPMRETPGPLEGLELQLLLAALAEGETSLLYRDLVDEKARKSDCGATNVGATVMEAPANVPMIFISGLPSSKLAQESLKEVRRVVMDRIRSLQGAKKGSELLAEFDRKALSLLNSSKRSTLKFMDTPPRFGSRSAGIGWHRHLDTLGRSGLFRRPVAFTPWYDELERRIRSGKNFWKAVIERSGMDQEPLVSAVRPDKSLLERERSEKTARLQAAQRELLARHGAKDVQEALLRHKAEVEAKTAELAERDRAVPRPRFVEDPPLTLDDGVDVEEGTLAGASRLVVSRFPSTPFTDLHLFFDARALAAGDLPYLPVLPSLLMELGVRTRSGESLDYAAMQERWRSEIFALGSGFSTDAKTGRVELSLFASGSTPQENALAAGWLENCLFRADVSSATAGRLRTVLRERIKELRRIFQLSEESWAREAADAVVYQGNPYWMSVASPMTELHHLNRVYFRVTGCPDDATWNLVVEVLDDLLKGAQESPREKMAARFKRLASGSGMPPALAAGRIMTEVGEYLSSEIAGLPEASWRKDLARMISQVRSDLGRKPEEEMERMRRLLASLLTRSNMQAAVTGSAANTSAVLPELQKLAEKLPQGEKQPKPGAKLQVLAARLQERMPALKGIPVHVGLVNNNTKSGVFVLSAPGPAYADAGEGPALDFLTAEVFANAAPHTFFLQTWAAGLAYSNGVRPSPSRGRISYYAERCPDLTATMRLVTGLAAGTKLDDAFFVDFALGNSFGDYRGAEGYSSRGLAARSDRVDGRTPETVKGFKTALVAAARRPDALERIRQRLPEVLGSVLVGYGRKMSSAPGASAFVTGPDSLLDAYEAFLRETGETDAMTRLYPRDFWIEE